MVKKQNGQKSSFYMNSFIFYTVLLHSILKLLKIHSVFNTVFNTITKQKEHPWKGVLFKLL